MEKQDQIAELLKQRQILVQKTGNPIYDQGVIVDQIKKIDEFIVELNKP